MKTNQMGDFNGERVFGWFGENPQCGRLRVNWEVSFGYWWKGDMSGGAGVDEVVVEGREEVGKMRRKWELGWNRTEEEEDEESFKKKKEEDEESEWRRWKRKNGGRRIKKGFVIKN